MRCLTMRDEGLLTRACISSCGVIGGIHAKQFPCVVRTLAISSSSIFSHLRRMGPRPKVMHACFTALSGVRTPAYPQPIHAHFHNFNGPEAAICRTRKCITHTSKGPIKHCSSLQCFLPPVHCADFRVGNSSSLWKVEGLARAFILSVSAIDARSFPSVGIAASFYRHSATIVSADANVFHRYLTVGVLPSTVEDKALRVPAQKVSSLLDLLLLRQIESCRLSGQTGICSPLARPAAQSFSMLGHELALRCCALGSIFATNLQIDTGLESGRSSRHRGSVHGNPSNIAVKTHTSSGSGHMGRSLRPSSSNDCVAARGLCLTGYTGDSIYSPLCSPVGSLVAPCSVITGGRQVGRQIIYSSATKRCGDLQAPCFSTCCTRNDSEALAELRHWSWSSGAGVSDPYVIAFRRALWPAGVSRAGQPPLTILCSEEPVPHLKHPLQLQLQSQPPVAVAEQKQHSKSQVQRSVEEEWLWREFWKIRSSSSVSEKRHRRFSQAPSEQPRQDRWWDGRRSTSMFSYGHMSEKCLRGWALRKGVRAVRSVCACNFQDVDKKERCVGPVSRRATRGEQNKKKNMESWRTPITVVGGGRGAAAFTIDHSCCVSRIRINNLFSAQRCMGCGLKCNGKRHMHASFLSWLRNRARGTDPLKAKHGHGHQQGAEKDTGADGSGALSSGDCKEKKAEEEGAGGRKVANTKTSSIAQPSKGSLHMSFVSADGKSVLQCPFQPGKTILAVAFENDVGIEGACGGQCACSTCHVIVEEKFAGSFPPPDDDEQDLLDTQIQTTHTSRLACQLKLSKEHDGEPFAISAFAQLQSNTEKTVWIVLHLRISVFTDYLSSLAARAASA